MFSGRPLPSCDGGVERGRELRRSGLDERVVDLGLGDLRELLVGAAARRGLLRTDSVCGSSAAGMTVIVFGSTLPAVAGLHGRDADVGLGRDDLEADEPGLADRDRAGRSGSGRPPWVLTIDAARDRVRPR